MWFAKEMGILGIFLVGIILGMLIGLFMIMSSLPHNCL